MVGTGLKPETSEGYLVQWREFLTELLRTAVYFFFLSAVLNSNSALSSLPDSQSFLVNLMTVDLPNSKFQAYFKVIMIFFMLVCHVHLMGHVWHIKLSSYICSDLRIFLALPSNNNIILSKSYQKLLLAVYPF